MNNSTITLAAFLNGQMAKMQLPAPAACFARSPLFQMVLTGDAKLPLHRVEEVASILDVDVRKLFGLAARQFYDEETFLLFERMFGTPVSDEEQMWLDEIRSASDGPVLAPSGMAKRLVRALAKPRG